jgi:hypothetical protein
MLIRNSLPIANLNFIATDPPPLVVAVLHKSDADMRTIFGPFRDHG